MEDARQKPSALLPFPLAVLAFIVYGWAVVGLLGGLGAAVGICQDPSPACERRGLLTAQFYLAVAGLIPVGVMTFAAVTKRRALAATAITIALLVYAVWTVLNDAAVHGWGEAMRLVP